MLIPIRHENMSARRWPVVTFALIGLNVVVFLATYSSVKQQDSQLGDVQAQIQTLVGKYPELARSPNTKQLVASFRDHPADALSQVEQPPSGAVKAAHPPQVSGAAVPQSQINSLATQHEHLRTTSITARYGFVPAHPRALTYLTANFLASGWIDLIGNIWFLWLAGFVLEDFWGRTLFAAFYLLTGAASLQFQAWFNPGSLVPVLGASGAVAALMGAFLVRFPKLKIEMAWLIGRRLYRFKAAAYWLVPAWLLMDVFYGALFSQSTTAAHVGGFAFGAALALGLRYTGFEGKIDRKVEDDLSWTNDPEITQASELIDRSDLDSAVTVLDSYLATKPDSVDALNLLCQIYRQRADAPSFQQAAARLCAAHLKAREPEAAWQDYEEFLRSGGEALPAGTWAELCHELEKYQNFERVVVEYEKLAAAYPAERQSLIAQLGAARVCLKLNRPADAIKYFEQAMASPIPHLDWEQSIQAGIHEAKSAMSLKASAATTQA
jgi:membrane associated rhomboid family serine protease